MKFKRKLEDNKEVKISVRFKIDENEVLREAAEAVHLSISDYIRICLFDENMTNVRNNLNTPAMPNLKFERSSMRLLVRMFGMVEALSKKELDKETLQRIEGYASKVLQDMGYEQREE